MVLRLCLLDQRALSQLVLLYQQNQKLTLITTAADKKIGQKNCTIFKLASLNIDSLLKHIYEFRVFIDQERPQKVSLNETKLDQSISDSLLEVNNYDIICNDRNRFGGGVALYVNKNLSYENRADLAVDNLESFSVQIENGKFKSFIVTSIYRRPEKPVSYFSYIECLIASLESENKESTIMSDTNCDFLDPSNDNTKKSETNFKLI